MPQRPPAPNLGLVLTGGGARTAYQVGVLLAINSWLQRPRQSPFAVITGTSAGAINASVLAAHAGSFGRGVEQLASVWRTLEVGHIFHCERRALYGRALRWVWALLRGGLGRNNPRALLDYQPLRDLLERHVNFARIDMQIRRGVLEGVAITASGYGSGRAVTFYQSASQVAAWRRERVQSRPTRLSLDHVMASVAIPLLFEAVRLGDDWYGDGSMRDHTPLSPAINLGARRLLVIATRNSESAPLPQPPPYPQLGKIAGYVLDSLFMDGTGSNLERVQRLNELARYAGADPAASHDQPWHQIDTCLVKPSQDLRQLATLHADRFPAPVRRLFRGIGAFGDLSPLPSYLLFDGTFCQALMNLGHADAQRQKDEIMALLAPE
ncbi:patatin-like phospholipase family protein [Immundisolibacter sp.]|uniref:patatin-like phospholipase family protein n=1 Tax=Immundisolibacter sp. TaxID=1934948 RepID=UPI0035679D17